MIDRKDNGGKEVVHPLPVIEVMSNTREAIETYRLATGMTYQEAALTLIMNEMRCMHWHIDQHVPKEVIEGTRKFP